MHQILILVLNFGSTGTFLHWKREIQMGENIEPGNQEKQMRSNLGKTGEKWRVQKNVIKER